MHDCAGVALLRLPPGFAFFPAMPNRSEAAAHGGYCGAQRAASGGRTPSDCSQRENTLPHRPQPVFTLPP